MVDFNKFSKISIIAILFISSTSYVYAMEEETDSCSDSERVYEISTKRRVPGKVGEKNETKLKPKEKFSTGHLGDVKPDENQENAENVEKETTCCCSVQ